MGTEIKIKGTAYPIKFGNGAFKILGKKWGFNGPQSIINKIAAAFPTKENPELTFDGMDILAEVVLAGFHNADKAYAGEYTEEEIVDLVILNPDSLKLVSDELVASFPGASGNAEPRSKARKTATKKK